MKKTTESYAYEENYGVKSKISGKISRLIGAVAAFCLIVSILLSESEFYLKDKVRMFCTEDGDFTKIVAWIDGYRTAEAMAENKYYVQKLAVPLNGTVVQSFGWDEAGNYNEDIVIKGETNAKVYCVLDGEVCEMIKTEQGWTVKIQHFDDLVSVYGGLNEVNLELGSYLRRDEAFATLKGEYMVFALYENGLKVDPLAMLGVEL